MTSRPIVEVKCPTCDGLKTVDHRYGATGFVTMEVNRVHVVPCPRCNAVGVLPAFKAEDTA